LDDIEQHYDKAIVMDEMHYKEKAGVQKKAESIASVVIPALL
jgi:hypothetical protein